MTDFVLEKQMSDKTIMNRFTQISNYANFLKQPLELWMFFPCDDYGNVFSEFQLEILNSNDEVPELRKAFPYMMTFTSSMYIES